MEILTRKEASELFKVSIRTIDYLVATNQIPYSRIGKRSVRFDKGRLGEWFKKCESVEFRHN